MEDIIRLKLILWLYIGAMVPVLLYCVYQLFKLDKKDKCPYDFSASPALIHNWHEEQKKLKSRKKISMSQEG